MFEKLKSDLLTGTCIGVGFEQKLILLTIYVLCKIHFDVTIDPNYPDEPYASLTSTAPFV